MHAYYFKMHFETYLFPVSGKLRTIFRVFFVLFLITCKQYRHTPKSFFFTMIFFIFFAVGSLL